MKDSTSKVPEISVVVCHHKGSFIYKFVESVKAQTAVSFEIIVVTSDDTLALAGIKGCTVINGPPLPAAKRNMGARIARGNYLGFFDDDVELQDDCLKNFWIKTTADCMSFGKLYNMERRNRFDEAGGFLTNTGFIWSRAGQNEVDTGQYDKVEHIFAGKSASCIIYRKLFEEIGGFDEDFGILGEETDLAWRVWLSGNRVLWVPNAIGYHAFNTKWKPASEYYNSERVHYNGCRNYITMLIKNLEAKNLWRILPIHVLIWFTASIIMCLTGKFVQGINILKGLAYVPLNLRKVLEKRRKVQERRVRSDSELWPHIFSRAPRGYYRNRFFRYIRIGLHG